MGTGAPTPDSRGGFTIKELYAETIIPLVKGTLSWLCAQTGVPLAVIGSNAGLDQPSAGQVNVLVGGNPELAPEEADTTTVGLVFTPLDNLSVTLDWWNIEINKAITNLTVNDAFDKKPPVVGNDIGNTAENSGNTFPQWYDALGRYVSVGVTFKF